MWHTVRGAKAVQIGVLLALGVVASRDVERTMRQPPMTREQAEAMQALIRERSQR
jgi:hypothetical protein